MFKNFVAPALAVTLAACSTVTPSQPEASLSPKAREALENCLAKTIQRHGGEFKKAVDGDVTTMNAVNHSRGITGQAIVNYPTGIVNVEVEKGGETAKLAFDFRYAQFRHTNTGFPGDAHWHAFNTIGLFGMCLNP